MSIAQNFPSVLPTLNLSFALTKALDPRITFARASAATYYGTETAKAEENLLRRSQEFNDGAFWGNVRTTDTANTDVAPDGTTTAETITEDTGAGEHLILQSVSATGQVTFSVFAKAGSGSRFLVLSVSRAGTHYGAATFDLSTQASTQTLIAGYSGSVTTAVFAAAQGFHRYSITVTTDTMDNVRIGLASTSTYSNFSRGFDSYTGDGTSSLILWGAQLEARDSATNYTPTTNQPITNFVPVLESAAAGEARFDHNPVTGESLGLLIEESRSNLLLRSEEFDGAGWSRIRSTITANTIVAPSGELTGDKLVENTENTTHFIRQSSSLNASALHTVSVYVKAAERTEVIIRLFFSAGWAASSSITVDLLTGSVVVAGSGATGSATDVGNGWYRVAITQSTNETTGTKSVDIFPALNGTEAYQGDGFSGIFLWGASLEQGAFPTSYVKTTTAQVTRAADVATMTGANFSSWYNQSESSIYVDYIPSQTGTYGNTLSIDDGSTSNRISVALIAGATGRTRYDIASGGALSVNSFPSPETFSAGSTVRLGFAFSTGTTAPISSLNGNAAVSAAGAQFAPPVVAPAGALALRIGHRSAANAFLNGHIRKVSYYPKRIANAELQGLTTV